MNPNYNVIKISQVYSDIKEIIADDLYLYDIKPGSSYHSKLLYHHTLKRIFYLKKQNPNSYIEIDEFKPDIPEKTLKRYTKFIFQLKQFFPTTIIQQTHHDPISIKILMNRLQKSTVKSKNLYKLRRFSEKYGLKEIVEEYLQDPSFRYVVSI